MGVACRAYGGEEREVCRILMGRPEGKRPLGRPRRRWEDDNGSSGSGMWGYGLDRAGLGYGQVAATCECGNEPSGSVKCGEFLEYLKTS